MNGKLKALDLPPGVVAAIHLETDTARAERLERENRALRDRNATLRNELNTMDARRQHAEDERDAARRESGRYSAHVAELNLELQALRRTTAINF